MTPITKNIGAKIRYIKQSKDHLGNVRAVISDRKLSTLSGTIPGDFNADLLASYSYYPFGMNMPGRTYNPDEYRYGFQGQEKDTETGLVNYKFRMHDPRIGRFFAVDPLTAQFSWNSPYAFSENRVIDGIELEGAETLYYMIRFDNNGQSRLKLSSTWNGRIMNVGWSNHVYYKGTEYFISAGSETADWLFSWIGDEGINGQWNRVKFLEGKSEEYLDNYFGHSETYANQQARRRAERDAYGVEVLTDAFTAGMGGKKKGLLSPKPKIKNTPKTKTHARSDTFYN